MGGIKHYLRVLILMMTPFILDADINISYINSVGSSTIYDGQLQQPAMNRIIGDKLYIADKNSIVIFDNNGSFDKNITFSSIYDIEDFVVDTNASRIYIGYANKVYIYELNGTLISSFGTGVIGNVAGLALAENRVFVTDNSYSKVHIYETNGTLVSSFGDYGVCPSQFNAPTGIEYANSKLYIADMYNNRVQVFDVNGTYNYYFGDSTSDVSYPKLIRVINDKIYINYSSYTVKSYELNGTYISSFGGYGTTDDKIQNISGLSVDMQGNSYVTDSNAKKIKLFDSNGTFVKAYGTSIQAGQLVGAFDVVAGGENIYVVDGETNSLNIFNSDGNVTKVGSFGTDNGNFNQPRYIAYSPNSGYVYVSDNSYRFQIFESNGTFVKSVGDYGYDSGDDFSSTQNSLAFYNSKLYVVDEYNYKVKIFDENGTYLSYIGGYGVEDGNFSNYPTLVAVANDKIYVYSHGSGIKIFDVNGNFLSKFSLTSGSFTDMSIGSDGNIYMLSYGSLSIYSEGGMLINSTYTLDGKTLSYDGGIFMDSNNTLYVASSNSVNLFSINSANLFYLASSTIVNNGKNIDLNTTPIFTFNKELNISSVNSITFKDAENYQDINFTLDVNGSQISLLNPNLSLNRSYYITIPNSITDVNGSTLSSYISINFKTKAPEIEIYNDNNYSTSSQYFYSTDTNSSKRLFIYNLGSDDLNISDINVSDTNFTLSHNCSNILAPNGYCEIIVSTDLTMTTSTSAYLNIKSNDLDNSNKQIYLNYYYYNISSSSSSTSSSSSQSSTGLVCVYPFNSSSPYNNISSSSIESSINSSVISSVVSSAVSSYYQEPYYPIYEQPIYVPPTTSSVASSIPSSVTVGDAVIIVPQTVTTVTNTDGSKTLTSSTKVDDLDIKTVTSISKEGKSVTDIVVTTADGKEYKTTIDTPSATKIEYKTDGTVEQTLKTEDSEVKIELAKTGEIDTTIKSVEKAQNVKAPVGTEAKVSESGDVTLKTTIDNVLVTTNIIPNQSTYVEIKLESGEVYQLNIPQVATDSTVEFVTFDEDTRAVSAQTYNALSARFTSLRRFTVDERRDSNLSTRAIINPLAEIVPSEDSEFEQIQKFDGKKYIKLLKGSALIILNGVSEAMELNKLYQIESRSVALDDGIAGERNFLNGSFLLTNGWHLISNPVDKNITKAEYQEIFGNYQALWTYKNGEWINEPEVLNSGDGFWVKINGLRFANFSGNEYKLELNVSEGWNIVGFGKDSYNLRYNNGFDTVWKYNSNSWIKNPSLIYRGEAVWIKK